MRACTTELGSRFIELGKPTVRHMHVWRAEAAVGARLALEAFAFANMANLRSARPKAKLALAPTARVLLVYMALRALDEDSPSGQQARRSFMRRSELGLAIGRFMPDREPPATADGGLRRAWEADDQAIKRALRELKAVGAIRELRPARAGRTAEFEITLGVTSRGMDSDPSRGTNSGSRTRYRDLTGI